MRIREEMDLWVLYVMTLLVMNLQANMIVHHIIDTLQRTGQVQFSLISSRLIARVM